MKKFLIFIILIICKCNIFAQVIELTSGVFVSPGSCNTYLIKTNNGYVLIDPGSEGSPASGWLKSLKDSVRAVLLTHGHPDHSQFIKEWHDLNVPIYVNYEFIEFQHYTTRLSGFYAVRNSMQQGSPDTCTIKNPGNFKAAIIPDHFYYGSDTLVMGDTHFIMIHTGGETPDQSFIWIPEKRTAFIGDNYYTSFPNMYTLRGTKPRWALGYIHALDLALQFKPEYLCPGHGEPLKGKEAVGEKVLKYKNASQYVHDKTVEGMNEGKDVFTLMKEIQLPDSLKIPEFFGRVSWSVRGIYEGYIGWFDGNITNMYTLPEESIYPELIKLSGGTETLVKLAEDFYNQKEYIKALHATDIILKVNKNHKKTLDIRLSTVKALLALCTNGIENAWLNYEINRINKVYLNKKGVKI